MHNARTCGDDFLRDGEYSAAAGALRVLLVEDNVVDAEALEAVLRDSGKFVVDRVARLDSALSFLAKTKVDVVLLDLNLPDSRGIDTFARVHAGAAATAIVIRTGLDDAGAAVDALRQGAQDYLVKGTAEGAILERSLRYAIERKRTEEALQRTARNFRTLVERLPDFLFVHRDGTLVYLNPGFLRWLGCERADELLGRTISDAFVHPDDPASVTDRILQITGESVSDMPLDARFVRKDGSVGSMELSGFRLNFDGGPANVVIARDVSERRQLQSRLHLSDRMASIGTLAAGVAHEINNPLAYVIANLEMIREELHSPSGDALNELEDMTREAQDGAARVRKIVQGLKTFSRAEEDRRSVIDLRAALESSVSISFNQIRHRARFVRDYGPMPLVLADEARLGQVFINLLVNAAHAIPEGCAESNEIRVTTKTGPLGHAVIEVRDTGSGIHEALRSRIFDPFFTTKPIGEGTGLGLSICHGIVTAHGGDILVESETGLGTLVRVTLPPAQPRVPAADRVEPLTPNLARRADILVIDDDPSVGVALGRALAKHNVVVEHDAREALARIAGGERFDLILCDLMMPQMDGVDLYSRILSASAGQAQRMIFITGGAFTTRAREFLNDLPNEWLEKPFEVSSLRALVGKFLQEGNPSRAEHPH